MKTKQNKPLWTSLPCRSHGWQKGRVLNLKKKKASRKEASLQNRAKKKKEIKPGGVPLKGLKKFLLQLKLLILCLEVGCLTHFLRQAMVRAGSPLSQATTREQTAPTPPPSPSLSPSPRMYLLQSCNWQLTSQQRLAALFYRNVTWAPYATKVILGPIKKAIKNRQN